MTDAPATPQRLIRQQDDRFGPVNAGRRPGAFRAPPHEEGYGSLIELKSALVVQTALSEGDADVDHRIYGDLR